MQSGTNWSYRFNAEIPRDASGSYSVGFEGRIVDVPIEGDHNEFTMRDQMQNFTVPIAVTDDVAESRDMIVDDTKCESCHSNLSLHGENRHDANGYCQTCHRADATDVNRRPADGEDQSIHFKYMIHKIHRGEDLARGYVVYGYGNREHDYSHVEYPRDLRECNACHWKDTDPRTDDATYRLPLPEGRLDTVAPQDFWSPMMPEAAACLSCHDGVGAAAHAANNTGEFGEACSACHGEDSTFSVEEVHSKP
jgi:OmcA/MtrC family decaheme c-type cytochrome